MFGKKEDYLGPEWISRRDRFYITDYHQRKVFVRVSGDIEILDEYCNACGYCAQVCPMKILELVDRKKPIKIGKRTITKVMRPVDKSISLGCAACGVCEAACPRDACYVSKPIFYPDSRFKTTRNKGPLSLPRLFNEKEGAKGRKTNR